MRNKLKQLGTIKHYDFDAEVSTYGHSTDRKGQDHINICFQNIYKDGIFQTDHAWVMFDKEPHLFRSLKHGDKVHFSAKVKKYHKLDKITHEQTYDFTLKDFYHVYITNKH